MNLLRQWIPFLALMVLQYNAMYAQADSVLVQNSKPVEKDRYRGIDGTPYYFEDWVIGSVLCSDGRTVDDVPLNYNGDSHEMEIRVKDEVYVLDKTWHLRVDVKRERNPALRGQFPVEQLVFMRGIHGDLAERYATIMFIGDQLTLIKDFEVAKTDKEFNTVSEKIRVKRFKEQSGYYLKKGSALIKLRLTKKKILEAFDEADRIAEFIDDEKINLSDEADLIRLVAYADTLQ